VAQGQCDDESCLFVSVYIPNIHPIDLVQTPKSPRQFPYHEEFFKLSDDADVVLVFGKLEGHEFMRRHPSDQAASSARALNSQALSGFWAASHRIGLAELQWRA
jgi:hypothetical protein